MFMNRRKIIKWLYLDFGMCCSDEKKELDLRGIIYFVDIYRIFIIY